MNFLLQCLILALARFLPGRNHPGERERRQGNELEHAFAAKPLRAWAGHALALLAVALSPAISPAHGGEMPSPSELLTVENELEQSELRQKELDERRAGLVKEEEGLSNQLVALAQKLREEERNSSAAAGRVKSLQREKAEISLELAKQQDVLSEVLAGLQRLEQNPPPALAVNPHDVLAALRSAMLFGTLAPDLRRAADELQEKLASLADAEEMLQRELAAQDKAMAALAAARGEVARLKEERRILAKSLNLDLEAERKRSQELAAKAQSLRDLLDRIAAEEAKAADRKNKAEAERQALEQRQKALATIPQGNFADQKGRLAYPAEGRIAKRFGEDTGLGRPLDGIVIATGPAITVTTPAAGLIEFAGPFRSYGEMVIINPGKNYLILLAGLGQVSVSPGQAVKAGEPVASMGERPVAMALAKDLTLATSPMLYVEFRKNGEPVDPAPWWAGPQAGTGPEAKSELKPAIENQEAMR